MLILILLPLQQELVAGPQIRPYAGFGNMQPNMVPNQLHSLAPQLHNRVRHIMPKLVELLVSTSNSLSAKHCSDEPCCTPTTSVRSAGPVHHTGYVVNKPFSTFRLALVTMMVVMVEFHPLDLKYFTSDLVRSLTTWFFQYPHTSMYHHTFVRFAYQVSAAVLLLCL